MSKEPIEEVKETKVTVLTRVPPGDSWTPVDEPKEQVFDSLTEGLEYIYQRDGTTQFYISARDGIVQRVEEETVTIKPEIKRYSLYGEH